MDTQTTGFVIWLTGMNRAGKSTLAAHLAKRLAAAGRSVELLDEDGDARMLLEGLGASKEDHAKAVARLGFVAKAVARRRDCGKRVSRTATRGRRSARRRRFVEVFADCSMEKLQQRDPQGIYRRALAGELKQRAGSGRPLRAADACGRDGPHRRDLRTRPARGLPGARRSAARRAGRVRLITAAPAAPGKPARAARGGARRKLVAKAAARQAPKKVAGRRTKTAKRRR